MVRTGIFFAGIPLAAGLLLTLAGEPLAAALCLALAAFVAFFFRDPEREVPAVPGVVVSPADGRVLAVETIQDKGGLRTKVSIFLSVFDVHVNRSPIAGTVERVEYRPGKFHLASAARASEENEQNVFLIQGEQTQVAVKQIAGILARRIEFWKQPGDNLARGERLGMIRFGSRVEVLLEPRYQVQVRAGNHVRGGTSILAKLP